MQTLLLWVDETGTLINSPKIVRNISYETIPENKKLRQQTAILEYLSTHNFSSNADIERDLNMRISSVTARINELRVKGLVCVDGSKINDKTGKLNITWKVL